MTTGALLPFGVPVPSRSTCSPARGRINSADELRSKVFDHVLYRTRYEKRAASYLAMVMLAAVGLWLQGFADTP